MASMDAHHGRIAEDFTIVDADSHLKPSPDQLLEYFDDDDAAKAMVEKASHVESEIFTLTRASAKFPNDSGSVVDHPNLINDVGYEPAGKAAYLDEFGIEHTILTPSGGTGGGGLATINHDPTAVSYAEAYNEWVLDTWLDVDDRFAVSVLVPNQTPERAADAIDDRAGERGIVAVQLPAAGLVPPAGHRQYDPIYAAAERHDLPILMHTHDGQATQTFPVQRMWAETFTESHAFTFPAEAMWHLISLVCNGVLERFPDLSWVFQEPGFEWLPWMQWRLDDHYLQNSFDLPHLTKPPSEYITDQCYFTTQPLGHTENRTHQGMLFEIAGGADTILFSSDHPHPDFDPPSEVIEPARTRLDDEELRGVMGETALDLFGLR